MNGAQERSMLVSKIVTVSAATFIRPANTTAYASGDLVANSVTAASVLPVSISVGRSMGGTSAAGFIRRVRLRKGSVTLTGASFRVHLYCTGSIVFTNGDNGAWLTDQAGAYLGRLDVTVDEAFSDGACGSGAPSGGQDIPFTDPVLWAVLEARGAYVPTSAEAFTIALEVIQN